MPDGPTLAARWAAGNSGPGMPHPPGIGAEPPILTTHSKRFTWVCRPPGREQPQHGRCRGVVLVGDGSSPPCQCDCHKRAGR